MDRSVSTLAALAARVAAGGGRRLVHGPGAAPAPDDWCGAPRRAPAQAGLPSADGGYQRWWCGVWTADEGPVPDVVASPAASVGPRSVDVSLVAGPAVVVSAGGTSPAVEAIGAGAMGVGVVGAGSPADVDGPMCGGWLIVGTVGGGSAGTVAGSAGAGGSTGADGSAGVGGSTGADGSAGVGGSAVGADAGSAGEVGSAGVVGSGAGARGGGSPTAGSTDGGEAAAPVAGSPLSGGTSAAAG
jgi:hypothetical protein